MARIDSTRDVELVSLSGTTYFTSATFVGDDYSVVFSPTDLSLWSNVSITVVNNSVNNLKSGSIEWSPNNTNWEVWDTTTLGALSSSFVESIQIAGNSRKYLRIRAIPSGSGGANSGSLGIYVITNNG